MRYNSHTIRYLLIIFVSLLCFLLNLFFFLLLFKCLWPLVSISGSMLCSFEQILLSAYNHLLYSIQNILNTLTVILVLCTSPNFTLKSIFIVYFPVNLRREDKLLELILLSDTFLLYLSSLSVILPAFCLHLWF